MTVKYITCCGDCINYNWKKHKCNLGAHVITDEIDPFYDDCPLPTIEIAKKEDET